MAKPIDKHLKRIPAGARAGKKIAFAPTEEVEAREDLASQFMSTIFGLDSGDYAISDESELFDFIPLDEGTDDDVWERIQLVYGLTRLDVGSGCLIRIFKAIENRGRTQ